MDITLLNKEEKWFNSSVIIFSSLLASFGWFIKAVLDSLFLYNKSFIEVLITGIPRYEFIIRFIVCSCFFIFGVFLSKNIIQRQIIEEKLKETNKALYIANKNLENKVKERTKKIENLLEGKDKLIIQLGHDLKTPLTPLMGLLPFIEEKEDDPEIKKLLQISIKNVHFIRNLVSKSIDIARLDSDLYKFNFEKTDFNREVEKVIETNRCIFDDNDFFVENNIDDNCFVRIDRLRIREVLNNLINNAVKFSNDGNGSIVFDADIADDFLLIKVKDTGLGLKSEEIDHVFDEFYKADESRHDLNSNGLGLSISKRIIEKHGGKIWLESKGEKKGLTVFFTLPLFIENK